MAKFRKGQSGNSAGKPKGARHRVTRAVEALLEGEAEGLTRKAVEVALSGDVTALRLCLDRISPVPKDRPLTIALPELDDAASIARAVAAVVKCVADGTLAPAEGKAIADLLEAHRRAFETEELERRIRTLEASQ